MIKQVANPFHTLGRGLRRDNQNLTEDHSDDRRAHEDVAFKNATLNATSIETSNSTAQRSEVAEFSAEAS